jgi:hypothetical protein
MFNMSCHLRTCKTVEDAALGLPRLRAHAVGLCTLNAVSLPIAWKCLVASDFLSGDILVSKFAFQIQHASLQRGQRGHPDGRVRDAERHVDRDALERGGAVQFELWW